MVDARKLQQCLRRLQDANRIAHLVIHDPPCPDDESRKFIWDHAMCHTLENLIEVCKEIISRTPSTTDQGEVMRRYAALRKTSSGSM